MRVRPKQLVAGVGVALLVLVAAACGSSSSKADTSKPTTTTKSAPKPTTTPTATAAAGGITIKGFAFHGASGSADVSAKVGQTITVKNEDSTAHTVTADDGSFDTKDIPAGGTATFTVSKAGRYSFHCAIHEYMKGTLTVS